MKNCEAPRGAVVSSESELLILVDLDDNPTGVCTKAECHDGAGLLHRAFSAFIFNSNGEMLLQRRAAGKRLWPGYWSNSCCSHPRHGEELDVAVARRLQQELGFQAALRFVYRFAYHAPFEDRGSERELCSVFVGRSDAPVNVNPTEIAEWRYVSAVSLADELRRVPERFTPWFRMEWETLQRDYAPVLAELTGG